MKINLKSLLRDVIIIWVFAIIGIIVDLFRFDGLLLKILLMSVGLTIIGCIVKVYRFRHLFVVAFALWVLSLTC